MPLSRVVPKALLYTLIVCCYCDTIRFLYENLTSYVIVNMCCLAYFLIFTRCRDDAERKTGRRDAGDALRSIRTAGVASSFEDDADDDDKTTTTKRRRISSAAG